MVESGIFYSTVIDPFLQQLRKRVSQHINPGDRVIDVACGTGAQLFELARLTASVTGVDLSDSMVRFAQKEANKRKLTDARFYDEDARDLSRFYGDKFDVAILSLALHQFDPDLRHPVLLEIQKVANKIVVLDYAVPLPGNYVGVASRVAEFLAGRDHNRNFKSYTRAGGLESILPGNGLSIEKAQAIGKGAFQLVVARSRV
ncbi:class I SAM-dependent methyltransferase [Maribellus sp. YY47]|uniref:class I SAM-dependent methyltransferase n=1 Tax=Maribellus sp. YY47 TaxID=2929486 RepID=UPI00200078A3|nr:class I SAM-dependent methyltransferase [Maribellus sp. YY47]MCK3682612.1 class I SAM-dependent methyltransferase [Maribellus sp. YY47]